MSNFSQTSNNGHQWHNQAFAQLFDSITAKLPGLTFWAILFSYVATAGLNCWAIHLPLFLSVPLSLAIQSLRFLCVFTPFLNPHGRASHLPEVIALAASVLALFELSFSLQAMGETGNSFWSLMLFGSAVLVLSMVLELQFINQGKKAFGLTAQKASGGGAVMFNQVQAVPTTNDQVQAMAAEIEFLKNQITAAQQAQPAIVGNETEKPTKQKKRIASELLKPSLSNGSSNGKHP